MSIETLNLNFSPSIQMYAEQYYIPRDSISHSYYRDSTRHPFIIGQINEPCKMNYLNCRVKSLWMHQTRDHQGEENINNRQQQQNLAIG